jgi:hypothetical protein
MLWKGGEDNGVPAGASHVFEAVEMYGQFFQLTTRPNA